MRHLSLVRLILFSVLLAGCSAVPQRNADFYFQTGLQAEFAGNWQLARQNYSRALVNAQMAGSPREYVSAVVYNLGRMTGYTCDYPEAEKLLREALDLEKGLSSPDPGNLTKRWSELGRLNYDQGRFQDSADWFGLALPELERLGMPSDDPVGFAIYIEDVAAALEKAGHVAEASALRARATSIRAKAGATSATFVPVYYRDVCGGA